MDMGLPQRNMKRKRFSTVKIRSPGRHASALNEPKRGTVSKI